MIYGMPILLELDNLEENVKLCKNMGLSFIEINASLPEFCNLDENVVKKIARYSNENINFSLHLSENFNPFDFSLLISQSWLLLMRNAITFAKKCGIKKINHHFDEGIYFTMPDKKIYLIEKYAEKFFEKVDSYADFCEKEIGDNDIKILIENTKPNLTTLLATEKLLNRKCFGITLDIGHNYCAESYSKEFLQKYDKKVEHLHLHDAKETADHLTIGSGEIDIDKYLQKYSNRTAVIEVKTIAGLKISLERLRNIEKNLYKA